MSEILEIYLNSKFGVQSFNNYNISDIVYNLPNVNISKNEKVYISVKNAVIPYSFYNVNNTNNKLDFTLNTFNYSITLTNGNYNVNTLKSHILSLLNINNFDWIINYIPKTNTFLFKHLINDFMFLYSSTCFELLGFKDNQNYSSISSTLESTISINLFTIKNIYVTSSNFILNNIDSNNHTKSNIICSIPVQGVQNSIIFYEDNAKHLIYNLNNINNLRITLNDEDGDLIDFNNIHYSMTIEITITK